LLDYPPRDAFFGHRNRLEEVLAKMVDEGALGALKSAKGAFVYRNAEKCRLNNPPMIQA
jgi:hypothetical protein